MATIQTLKADNDIIIRQQVAVNSINTDEVADRYDAVADELLLSGIASAATTAAMARSSLSGNNYNKCIVKNNGTFEWLASGTIDGVDVFAASGGGVWSRISTDAGGAGGGALEDLTNVVITAPVPGDRLTWNGTEWVNTPIFWEDGFDSDFLQSVEPDKLILGITVENTTNLVAFKIGTTMGGDDVVATQPILLADSPQYFSVGLPTGPGLTLYFGGVTDQIYTKTYFL